MITHFELFENILHCYNEGMIQWEGKVCLKIDNESHSPMLSFYGMTAIKT